MRNNGSWSSGQNVTMGGAVLQETNPGIEMTTSMMKVRETTPPLRSTKWVLVMDDEAAVRTVTRLMLEQIGYQAYVTENGEEAIECYRIAKECGYPFAAVIVDLSIMNGMGGKEAIKRLCELDPDVKAIVATGNTYDPAVTHFSQYGFKKALIKPYTIEELGQALQGALNEVGQA